MSAWLNKSSFKERRRKWTSTYREKWLYSSNTFNVEIAYTLIYINTGEVAAVTGIFMIIWISLSSQSSSLKCHCMPELHQFFFQLPTPPVPALPAIVSHTDTYRESWTLGDEGNWGLGTHSLCIAVIIIYVTCMQWRLLYAVEVSVGKQAVSIWEGFLTLASIRYSLHATNRDENNASFSKLYSTFLRD